VEQITPELVDEATDQPLPDREQGWSILSHYRFELARRVRDWPAATRLQNARIASNRQRVHASLAADPATLDDTQRNEIRSLAISLHDLAELLREQRQPDCIPAYTEALELLGRIGDQQAEAIAASNLGLAYLDIPGLRDLDNAEYWIQRALDRLDPADNIRRARSTGELGGVYRERFHDARAAGRPQDELLSYINAALAAYNQTLDLFPADAVSDLAVTHNQLGHIYDEVGHVDAAMSHYRDAVRYHEAAADLYRAAETRTTVANLLVDQGRLEEAEMWAEAAVTGAQQVGSGGAGLLAEAMQLLAKIEQVHGPEQSA
jgi:tetratricopeptide (TPR) repeat protein